MSSDDGSSFEDPSVRPFLKMLSSSHKFTKSALNNKLKKTANINTKKLSSLQRKLMTKNDTSKTANMKWDGSV
jgi:hypothetical protein